MQISLPKILYTTQWSLGVFVIYAFFGGKDSVLKLFRSTALVLAGALLARVLTKKLGVPVVPSWLASYFFVCASVWAILLARLLIFVPFPDCKTGSCHDLDDYHWCHGDFFGKRRWGLYFYTCRCKVSYMRIGRRFMEFVPERTSPDSHWINLKKGTRLPFKRLDGFRKWVDDI